MAELGNSRKEQLEAIQLQRLLLVGWANSANSEPIFIVSEFEDLSSLVTFDSLFPFCRKKPKIAQRDSLISKLGSLFVS
jgi:hypothetical protein